MNTIQPNYFAPLPTYSESEFRAALSLPLIALPKMSSLLSTWPTKNDLEHADAFTYVIMGLAVFIAILIPALNWI